MLIPRKVLDGETALQQLCHCLGHQAGETNRTSARSRLRATCARRRRRLPPRAGYLHDGRVGVVARLVVCDVVAHVHRRANSPETQEGQPACARNAAPAKRTGDARTHGQVNHTDQVTRVTRTAAHAERAHHAEPRMLTPNRNAQWRTTPTASARLRCSACTCGARRAASALHRTVGRAHAQGGSAGARRLRAP